MTRKLRTKKLNLAIEVPDDKALKHITDGYGLYCAIRKQQGLGHERVERWLLRLTIEGVNALFSYEREQHKLALEKQQAAAEKPNATESDVSLADTASTEDIAND